MGLNEVKYEIKVEGMICSGCEVKIEKKLKQSKGILSVNANYLNSLVNVVFDQSKISLNEIQKIILKLDYVVLGSSKIQETKNIKKTTDKNIKSNTIKKDDKINFKDFFLIVTSVYFLSMVLKHSGLFQIFNDFPQATEGASYIALFLIGVLTSLHCVAMCGGINLSQCINNETNISIGKISTLKPSFLYNSGRVVSYTIIGGIVGALGSVISFSPFMKGMVTFLAGGFMIIMGLNMLNIFPWLKKFSLRMPKIFINKLDSKKNNSSFCVGILNGFMPCGPLQAMQLFALSTGSPIKGALSMFFFSIGTFQLMFLLGAVSTFLTKNFTAKMMSASSILVIFMGVFMFNNGIALAGLSVPTVSNIISKDTERSSNVATITDEKQNIQTVSFDLSARSYEPITVKSGVPVKWIINADVSQITGCNNELIIPNYNISKKLLPGENIIEFTPNETGVIPYSCWMGMIRSNIIVE